MTFFTAGTIDVVLQELRGDHHWSDLAEAADVDPSTLSAIRSGSRKLSTDIAMKIARGIEELRGESFSVGDLYEQIAREQYKSLQTKVRKQYGGDLKVGHEFKTWVKGQLENLKEGDRYTIISSKLPLEMQSLESEFLRKILEAASKRAVFLYVYPQDPADSDEDADQYGPALFMTDSIGFDRRFKVWKRQLLKQIGPDQRSLIKEGLEGKPISMKQGALLFSPFIKYITLEHNNESAGNDEDRSPEAWIEITSTALEGESCLVKLDSLAARSLVGHVRTILEENGTI